MTTKNTIFHAAEMKGPEQAGDAGSGLPSVPEQAGDQTSDVVSTFDGHTYGWPATQNLIVGHQRSSASSLTESSGRSLGLSSSDVPRRILASSYLPSATLPGIQHWSLSEAMLASRSSPPYFPAMAAHCGSSSTPSGWQSWSSTSPLRTPLQAKGAGSQQTPAYKQLVMDAHTDWLGETLGLGHSSLSSGEALMDTASSAAGLTISGTHRSIDPHIKISPLVSLQSDTTAARGLPQCFDNVILIVDANDTVICSSTPMMACADMLSEATCDEFYHFGPTCWMPSFGNSRNVTFSTLLADEHAVFCWQQACQEVKAETSRRLFLHGQEHLDSVCLSPRKELVLKQRSRQADEGLIELTIVAGRTSSDEQDAYFMVNVKTLTVPSIVTAPLHPRLTDPYPSSLRYTCRSMAGNNAELRLLVSRYGLILRTSLPRDCFIWHDCTEASPAEIQERATIAVLGKGASLPLFGQSLVEEPRLAALLHVVAEAAVGCLAQTIRLPIAGRQVTATVQPVFGIHACRSQGSEQTRTAAKVWVTLSASPRLYRRPSSALPSRMTRLGGTLPDGTYQRCSGAQLRRHSELESVRYSHFDRTRAGAALPTITTPTTTSVDRSRVGTSHRGLAAQFYRHATPSLSSADGDVAGDSLSVLNSRLEAENRGLRRQIEIRRRRG